MYSWLFLNQFLCAQEPRNRLPLCLEVGFLNAFGRLCSLRNIFGVRMWVQSVQLSPVVSWFDWLVYWWFGANFVLLFTRSFLNLIGTRRGVCLAQCGVSLRLDWTSRRTDCRLMKIKVDETRHSLRLLSIKDFVNLLVLYFLSLEFLHHQFHS